MLHSRENADVGIAYTVGILGHATGRFPTGLLNL